jgi:hypothetical protein
VRLKSSENSIYLPGLGDLLEHVGVEVEAVVAEHVKQDWSLLSLAVLGLFTQLDGIVQQLGRMLPPELREQADGERASERASEGIARHAHGTTTARRG